MSRVTVTTRVERLPAAVFDFMTDPAFTSEWAPKAEYADTQGNGPTRRGVEVRHIAGLRVGLRWHATAYQPPSRLGYLYRWGPLTVDVLYTLVASGAATLVTVDADVQLAGPFAVLAPAVAFQIRRDDTASFARLKRAIEALGPNVGLV